MTMSLTIVNTSNWDGEDYIVTEPATADSPARAKTIKPGERTVVSPRDDGTNEFVITATVKEDKKPFVVPVMKKDGTMGTAQTWPEVIVKFREPKE